MGALALSLSACANFTLQRVGEGEAPLVMGPAVRDNRTPLDAAYRCYGGMLKHSLRAPLSVGVGEVRDYTGKYSDLEGSAVTQGASPMLFSALFKLGGAVRVHERFDTRVAELELAYLEKKRLGTGHPFQVGKQTVPWMPYFGGTILNSKYYIVGGITELNYNIQSGGAEFRISQTGPKARVYSMNVAADLRLVNTETLVVESAVSVQKQLTGFEVGFELFRFFGGGSGSELVDINIGNKSQEPLQLGVRAVLELGALKLLGDVSGVDYRPCLPTDWRIPSDEEMAKAGPAPQMQQAAIVAETPSPAQQPMAAAPAEPKAVGQPKPMADGNAAPVSVKNVVYDVKNEYVVVIVETDGRPDYSLTTNGHGATMRIRNGAVAATNCGQPPVATPIARSAECGQAGDNAILSWRSDMPLIVTREENLTKEAGGINGVRFMLTPATQPGKGRPVSSGKATKKGDEVAEIPAKPKAKAKAPAPEKVSQRRKGEAETAGGAVADAGAGHKTLASANGVVPVDPLKGAPSLSLVD
ncbi:MAG: hypothetical protein KDC18_04275 [Alphaproteobacteria bacterium]|nr:hypothetical protein [Alphaproteobacteria bacterium]MCB9930939.1 hypothetical protein [Alphaproteobacteria bacterium]